MKRKTDSEIKAELRSIYAGHDGEMPDLSKLEQRKNSWFTRFLVRSILFLIVVSALAWGGFVVWSRGGVMPSRPLKTSVEVPDKVTSGEEAFFTFRYENSGNAPIASLAMKLTVPPDFTVTSRIPEPTDATTQTWTLGSLTSGSDGAIRIGGYFRSEVPSSQTIQALYTYKPANFSSDFQDISTAKANVETSVLGLTVTGPEKALAGDDVTYVINVQNSGTKPATNVLVGATLPEGFTVTKSDPAPAEPNATAWTFEAIAPAELKAVTITGRYSASISGEQKVAARVSFLNADEIEFQQAASEAKSEVVGGAVAFHLIVNGSAADQTANPGDALRISIDYANNGNETIKNLGFKLSLSGDGTVPTIDWAKADLGGGTNDNGTISWDAAGKKEFAAFSPSTKGTIDLVLPIVSDLRTPGLSSVITLALSASLDEIGAISGAHVIDATPLVVKVNSDFRSSAHAEYFDKDLLPVGTGPLPPKVGETTKYRVVWRVANSFHPLENVRMTTNLPPKVAWVENAHSDVGTVTFDQTTRVVTWLIDKFPTTLPGAEASFDVAITPDAKDAGSFYKLTNAIAVEATDTFTKDQVSNGIDILTTELPEDKGAAGKGVVAK